MAAVVGAIVERSVAVLTAIKVAGALDLVILGIRSVRHREEFDTPTVPGAARRRPSPPRDPCPRGFVIGVADPEAIVFFAALLPQPVRTDDAAPGRPMASLGLVVVAMALVSDGARGLAAGTARRWFASSPAGFAGSRAVAGS